MAFLLIAPLAVFGLVALLALGIHIRIEITERRRTLRKSMRRIFRPVVIQGGKGKIAANEPPQPAVSAGNQRNVRTGLTGN